MNTNPVFEAEERVDLSMNSGDLAAEIRQMSPPRKVYQPAQEWVTVELFGGGPIFFPPDLPGAPLVAHPAFRDAAGRPVMVPANGTTEIKDRYGPVFDSKRRKFVGHVPPNPPPLKLLRGQTANDFLLLTGASEKYRNMGVTWLREDGKDELRKKAAKAIYHTSRRKQAEQEIATRAETVANFKKLPQNAGQTPPPPTAAQVTAQEFLDEIRSEGRIGSEFICKHGCYETNDRSKYARHMLVNHKETVAQEVEGPDVPDNELAEKRKPGRPRKAEAVA